jgi:rubrerythrin
MTDEASLKRLADARNALRAKRKQLKDECHRSLQGQGGFAIRRAIEQALASTVTGSSQTLRAFARATGLNERYFRHGSMLSHRHPLWRALCEEFVLLPRTAQVLRLTFDGFQHLREAAQLLNNHHPEQRRNLKEEAQSEHFAVGVAEVGLDYTAQEAWEAAEGYLAYSIEILASSTGGPEDPNYPLVLRLAGALAFWATFQERMAEAEKWANLLLKLMAGGQGDERFPEEATYAHRAIGYVCRHHPKVHPADAEHFSTKAYRLTELTRNIIERNLAVQNLAKIRTAWGVESERFDAEPQKLRAAAADLTELADLAGADVPREGMESDWARNHAVAMECLPAWNDFDTVGRLWEELERYGGRSRFRGGRDHRQVQSKLSVVASVQCWAQGDLRGAVSQARIGMRQPCHGPFVNRANRLRMLFDAYLDGRRLLMLQALSDPAVSYPRGERLAGLTLPETLSASRL